MKLRNLLWSTAKTRPIQEMRGVFLRPEGLCRCIYHRAIKPSDREEVFESCKFSVPTER